MTPAPAHIRTTFDDINAYLIAAGLLREPCQLEIAAIEHGAVLAQYRRDSHTITLAKDCLLAPWRVLVAIMAHEYAHAVAGPVPRSHGVDFALACIEVAKALPWPLQCPRLDRPPPWGAGDPDDWRQAFVGPAIQLTGYTPPQRPSKRLDPHWLMISRYNRLATEIYTARRSPPPQPKKKPTPRRALLFGLAALAVAFRVAA